MGQTIVQRSFAGGEIAPGLAARADLPKYLSALRTCRNFLVRRHGGVANRPGTKFVAETKTSGSARTFLQPFTFAASSKSFVLECGDNYIRFFKNGAPVLVTGVVAWSAVTAYVVGDLASSAGVNYYCILGHTNQVPPNATYWYPLTGAIYEIPTPWPSGAFLAPAPACFAQAGLVLTITHLNYPPYKLEFTSDTRWVLSPIVTGPWASPPAGPGGVAGAAGARTFRYVVTAGKAETFEETNPSAVITIAAAAAPTVDLPHALAWTAVAGAAEYYVYGDGGAGNSTFGYLGAATGVVTFNDPGFVPDFGQTPPIPRPLFNATNLYPAVNTVYQQRRLMAGSHIDREQIFASQVGFYANFGIRSPLQEDDAVTFTIAAQCIQPVLHLIGLQAGLVVLTDAGEWVVRGDEAGGLSPTAINPRQHGYVGASFTTPVVLGEAILFVQARGTILRDLRFDVATEGLSGRDLTLYAAHLVNGYTLDDLAYAHVPDSVVWAIRSDGVLLGLTYIREEDVWGWHRHDTNGTFEQVCVIPEGTEDGVYVIVKRHINGADKRYVERFASRQFTALADAFFVDAGITYSGVAATLITGLAHLRGEVVSVLADGVVPPGVFTVSATGTITIPVAAVKVQVGLPIVADLETLDLDVSGTSLRDKKKRIKAISLLLESSSRGFFVGPDLANLIVQSADPWDAAGLVTGQVQMNLTSGFTDDGRTLIRHTQPLPLTVLGLLPEVVIGG